MNNTIEIITNGQPANPAAEEIVERSLAVASLQARGEPLPLDGGWGGLGSFDEERRQLLGGRVMQVRGISYAGEPEVTPVWRPYQTEAMQAFNNRPA